MANKLYEEADISNIATAIRSKSNSTSNYKVSEMADAISNISSGDDSAFWVGHKLGVNCTLPSNITTMSNTYTYSNQYSIKIYYKSNNVTTIASNTFSNSGTVGFDFPNLTSISNYGCAYSEQLTQPIVFYSPIVFGQKAFSDSGVPLIDFRSNVDLGTYMTFAYDYGLTTFIIRSPELVPLASTNILQDAAGRTYIYVPASLVDEYKAATNWVNYSNQIRAIEDYPEITGGES